jgi:23S rRNA (guanine745-N1)-methyltransferase
MNALPQMSLLCPVCQADLNRSETTLRCANSHSFDVARQGYVNLLLEKPRGDSGDSKEMLQARNRFLASGHYRQLSDAINQRVQRYLSGKDSLRSTRNVLDIGCGEGYYLGRLKQFLDGDLAQSDYGYYGIDISKDAVRMAAASNKGIFFIAMDSREKILFADGSVDVLLNIFAPRNAAEFACVLAPDALLLSVIPGPDHLIELRTAFDLLSIEKEKQQKVVEQFADGFKFIDSQTMHYEMSLSNHDVVNLVNMMPSYRHPSPERVAAIKQQENFQTTAEFALLTFRKR